MKRTRTETVTLDGRTHTYPVPLELPSDRDAQALAAVTGVSVVIVGGALVWSTVSIGSLLSFAAPAWSAYLVAGVFDLAWITAMTLEWLSRHDRQRAAFPRNAGWLALAVSMGLIALHGYVQGTPKALAAGIAGALVALVSKATWHLVMRHTSVVLDDATAAWLRGERNDLGAQRATVAARRELTRVRALIELERAALSVPGTPPEATRTDGWGDAPVRPPWLYGRDGRELPRTDNGTVLDTDWLRASGWVQGPDGDWSTADGTDRESVRPQPGPMSVQRSVRPIGSGSVQSAVNQFLADHPDTDTDSEDGRTAVRDAVRSVLPDATTDHIGKAIRRARRAA